MGWVDKEYAELSMRHLPRFRNASVGTNFKLNSRCPVCGDSSKDELKARFWAYSNSQDDSIVLHCYNCGYHNYLGNFLRDYNSELYKDYIVEKFGSHKKEKPEYSFDSVLPIKYIERLEHCERCDALDENHPILKYLRKRKIPSNKFHKLWFTIEWRKLVNSVHPGTYKNESREARLVIPMFNKEGKIESMQGRALKSNDPNKYITIKACENASKIYGLDGVDEKKMVYFLEGPIDTLFLENSCAITGGSLSLDVVPYKDNRAFVLDNEPRHPDTIKRMRSLIDKGENIVLWDKAPWVTSDINDMLVKENANLEEVVNYIKNNVVYGLEARLRFEKWAKL